MQNNNKIITLILLIGFITSAYFLFFQTPKTTTAAWWNDAWGYRKELHINPEKIAGNLTDFPVLVSMTDSDLSDNAQADGDDIVFIDLNGQKLSHEIEKYSSSTGDIIVWVKISKLWKNDTVSFYMYYGNPSAGSGEDTENVWNKDFYGVWHMDSDATTTLDSTANNKNGVNNGGISTSTGAVGNAIDFDSNTIQIGSDHISINYNELHSFGSSTYSGWFYHRGLYNNYGNALFGVGNSKSNTERFWITVGATSTVGISSNKHVSDPEVRGATSENIFNENEWTHFVYTTNDSGHHLYINGTEESLNYLYGTATTSCSINDMSYADADMYASFGAWNRYTRDPEYEFNGAIDEMRISSLARSSAWIQTEYNNQSDPSGFFTVGSEETGPGPAAYWSFNEGYGTTAHDESGQGNDGAISGAVWKGEEECVSGKCLQFDGSGDYVEITDFDF